jgi:hypothetical protein
MIKLNYIRHRALRQMKKAIERGDFDAALKWSLIVDAQLLIAKRLSDLTRRRHRSKPRKPPAKPDAAPATKTAPSKAARVSGNGR